jgi:integrase
MRRDEIVSLTWDKIDCDRRVLTIELTKNGDKREVSLSTKAPEILSRLRGFNKPFDVNKDVLTALFRRACIECGVLNAVFHDARATALTRLSTKLSVLELARMVGHRDLKSLMIYYRETADELAKKLD